MKKYSIGILLLLLCFFSLNLAQATAAEEAKDIPFVFVGDKIAVEYEGGEDLVGAKINLLADGVVVDTKTDTSPGVEYLFDIPWADRSKKLSCEVVVPGKPIASKIVEAPVASKSTTDGGAAKYTLEITGLTPDTGSEYSTMAAGNTDYQFPVVMKEGGTPVTPNNWEASGPDMEKFDWIEGSQTITFNQPYDATKNTFKLELGAWDSSYVGNDLKLMVTVFGPLTFGGDKVIGKGMTVAIPATGGYGNPVYTIANETYATIDSATGTVTAKDVEGSVKITATIAPSGKYPEQVATYTLTVSGEALAFTNPTEDVNVGQILTIAATGGQGTPTYSIANTDYATVDAATGTITGTAPGGPVTVTAKIPAGGGLPEQIASYELSIIGTALAFEKPEYGIGKGGSATYPALGGYGTPTYSIEGNIATINPTTGEVTAGSEASEDPVTVTAKIAKSATTAEQTATYELTVLDKLSFPSTTADLNVNEMRVIAASGGTGTPTYSIENTDYATIDTTTGKVTGTTAGGPVTVTATIPASGETPEQSASYELRVIGTTLSFPSSADTINVAEIKTTAANGGFGTPVYTIANTDYATIDASTGKVTGTANSGTSTVTVTATIASSETIVGQSAAYDLTVTGEALAFAGPQKIGKGFTATYPATGGYGTPTYTIENTLYAQIDSATGKVTGIAKGGPVTVTATIAASATNTPQTATYQLEVVDKLMFPNPTASVAVGQLRTIAAVGGQGGPIVYTIPHTDFATIDSSTGEVTGVAKGGPVVVTATIAQSGDVEEQTASYELSVDGQPLAFAGDKSVQKGFKATYAAAGGYGIPTYTIENTDYATIDASTGEVTGVTAGGPVKVTATIAGSSGVRVEQTATYNLTVADGITFPSSSAEISVGEKRTIIATGGVGTPTYSIEHTQYATIDSVTGTVIGTGNGGPVVVTATIPASGEIPEQKASYQLSVSGQPLAFPSETASVEVDQYKTIAATGGFGTPTYTIENTNYATIDASTGKVTGTANSGTSTVTVTATIATTDTSVQQSTSYQLTVTAGTALAFSSGTASVEVDQYKTIAATGGGGTGTVTYSIEGSTATVDSTSGKVTGTAAGVAVAVTATKAASGTTTDGYLEQTAEYQLTVGAGTPLTFSSGTASLVVDQYKTIATTGGGGTGAVTYSIEGSTATVDSTSGKVTGTAAGVAVAVTATKAASGTTTEGYLEQTTSYQLTVTAGTALAFSSGTASIEVDQYKTIAATGGAGTGTVTYSIAGSTATIDSTSGKVTGTAAGEAVAVTATKAASGTTTEGYVEQTAEYQLTVDANTFAIAGSTSVMTFTNTTGYSASGGGGTGTTSAVIISSSPTDGRAYLNGSTLGSGLKTGNVVLTATKAGSGDSANGWLEQTAELWVTVSANDRKAIAFSNDRKVYMNDEKTSNKGETNGVIYFIADGQYKAPTYTALEWVSPTNAYTVGDIMYVYISSQTNTGYTWPAYPTTSNDTYIVLR